MQFVSPVWDRVRDCVGTGNVYACLSSASAFTPVLYTPGAMPVCVFSFPRLRIVSEVQCDKLALPPEASLRWRFTPDPAILAYVQSIGTLRADSAAADARIPPSPPREPLASQR